MAVSVARVYSNHAAGVVCRFLTDSECDHEQCESQAGVHAIRKKSSMALLKVPVLEFAA